MVECKIIITKIGYCRGKLTSMQFGNSIINKWFSEVSNLLRMKNKLKNYHALILLY